MHTIRSLFWIVTRLVIQKIRRIQSELTSVYIGPVPHVAGELFLIRVGAAAWKYGRSTYGRSLPDRDQQ
jgi:hypothetical protein